MILSVFDPATNEKIEVKGGIEYFLTISVSGYPPILSWDIHWTALQIEDGLCFDTIERSAALKKEIKVEGVLPSGNKVSGICQILNFQELARPDDLLKYSCVFRCLEPEKL
jgi:hypothetical protein